MKLQSLTAIAAAVLFTTMSQAAFRIHIPLEVEDSNGNQVTGSLPKNSIVFVGGNSGGNGGTEPTEPETPEVPAEPKLLRSVTIPVAVGNAMYIQSDQNVVPRFTQLVIPSPSFEVTVDATTVENKATARLVVNGSEVTCPEGFNIGTSGSYTYFTCKAKFVTNTSGTIKVDIYDK